MKKSIVSSKAYQSLCTEYYNLDKPAAPPKALSYYMKHAEKAQGPILEPMCGTGNFLIPLFQKGFNITGFDNSRHMLGVCRKKRSGESAHDKLYEASFKTFVPLEKYRLIFIPNGSFCLLADPKEANYALNRICEWLENEGKFIFEIETLHAARKDECTWKSNWVRKQDGSLIVLNHIGQFDPENGIETVLCRYEHWKNNRIKRTETEEFRLKRYAHTDIEKLLHPYGFQIKKSIPPYEKDHAKSIEKAEMILYECKKQNKQCSR